MRLRLRRLATASVGKSDGTVAPDPVRRPPTMIVTVTVTATATATANATATAALSVLVLMANAFITHTPRGVGYEIKCANMGGRRLLYCFCSAYCCCCC